MKTLLRLVVVLFTAATFAQAGHIMQGVGAVNMSMGGASTAQPLDISGALQWNPAAISTFDSKILNFDLGLFFSSPELSATLPAGMLGPGAPSVSGITEDDRGVSPMPALAMVWGNEDSKHTFGVSAFGISGFGVTFPEEANNPLSPTFNPMENSNPINYPQMAGGFGHLESDYMLLQVGLTWAYELSDNFSIGIEPTLNYGALELSPNPTASPNAAGYGISDKASSIGFGAQIGMFYESDGGFKLGASYKTTQSLGDLEFENTHLDNQKTTNEFNMDYPAILSFGVGYSNETIDFALDYRMVDYENTDGFAEKGWVIAESGQMQGFPTGNVKGFGWENINIISAGMQYKGIDKMPLRVGYTYSSNPINEELTFFSTPATAIIANAFQFGIGYEFNDNFTLNGVFHYGTSDGKTEGPMLNPRPDIDMDGDGFPEGPWNGTTNPLGKIPGSNVGYEMTTSMIQFGISYNFNK